MKPNKFIAEFYNKIAQCPALQILLKDIKSLVFCGNFPYSSYSSNIDAAQDYNGDESHSDDYQLEDIRPDDGTHPSLWIVNKR